MPGCNCHAGTIAFSLASPNSSRVKTEFEFFGLWIIIPNWVRDHVHHGMKIDGQRKNGTFAQIGEEKNSFSDLD